MTNHENLPIMQITAYHARYFAYELTKRCSSDSIEKLTSVLADSQVDLNPHQVEAALFAFRSPFSRGAILADEVGLGKTVEAVDALPQDLPENWEEFEELADEWDGEEGESDKTDLQRLTPDQLIEVRHEINQLRLFYNLAKSIIRNSEGEVLLTALRRGFDAATEAQKNQGAATLQQKAVIFTESRRTQDYLYFILEQTEFAGKVMLFNGTNTDPRSKGIYRLWMEKHTDTDQISGSPSADMRAAAGLIHKTWKFRRQFSTVFNRCRQKARRL